MLLRIKKVIRCSLTFCLFLKFDIFLQSTEVARKFIKCGEATGLENAVKLKESLNAILKIDKSVILT